MRHRIRARRFERSRGERSVEVWRSECRPLGTCPKVRPWLSASTSAATTRARTYIDETAFGFWDPRASAPIGFRARFD